MSREKDELPGRVEGSTEEQAITRELAELQYHLELLSVKYPDEQAIHSSIEQLRMYVPRKKPLVEALYSQLLEGLLRIFPLYRFTSMSLFFFGSLLLPNKIY